MKKQYHKILDFEIKHMFYKDGIVSAFDLFPLTDDFKFINNHRLIFRQTPKGFMLLQEGEKIDGSFKPTIDFNHRYLYFGLSFNDALFQIKSDIKMFKSKDSKLAIICAKEGIFTILAPNVLGSFLLSDLDYSANITLCDIDKQPILNLMQNDSIYLPKRDEFIYLNDNIFFCSLKKYLCDAVICLPIKNLQSTAKYNAKIEARFIRWMYTINFIYSDVNKECNLIDEGSNNIEFLSLSSDNKNVKKFISKDKIQLKQYYDYEFSIYLDNELLLSNLPCADLNKTKLIENDELILEIILNI